MAISSTPLTPPVDERRLWLLQQNSRTAEARARRMGRQVELSVWVAGDRRFTRLFDGGSVVALHTIAASMREQFLQRGWNQPMADKDREDIHPSNPAAPPLDQGVWHPMGDKPD